MKKCATCLLCMVFVFSIAFSLSGSAFVAVSAQQLDSDVTKSAEYIYKAVKAPQFGAVGGEWVILGLARSGYTVPDAYYRDYYASVEKYVQDCKGVLHSKKYTEYSRAIIGLAALGIDARSVGGYDLTLPLSDYDKTIWQGVNGPIWALIALDSLNYPMPVNSEAQTQATRQMYVDRILECQMQDGGWSLLRDASHTTAADASSDPDITGMALQALAKYQDESAVKKATDEALECMSKMQNERGGFGSRGAESIESCVQMVVALCELGIPLDDARFVKNGNSLLDNLMSFRTSDGGFKHLADDEGTNQMSAEQGLYALAAVQRLNKGQNSLYRMGDARRIDVGTAASGFGLPGKSDAVKPVPITLPGTTFDDISTNASRAAIEALAARGIINGKAGGIFDPDAKMTRAEFATITVCALGLTPAANEAFTDVTPDEWYAPFIGTAYNFKIVSGIGGGLFNPEGTLTKEEAAAMLTRAAKLCGMETDYSVQAVRDILAQFVDYIKTSDWAQSSLAFCYDSGILDDSALSIEPQADIKRCEIAQMIFNLLDAAKLL